MAGFTVTPTGGGNVVNENGSTDTFDVVLTAQPAADVVLTLSNRDAGEVTVSPVTLTFTPANWNVPQTVTLAGVADGVVDGTQTTTLTLAVDDAASDDAFDAVADQTVNVDDDRRHAGLHRYGIGRRHGGRRKRHDGQPYRGAERSARIRRDVGRHRRQRGRSGGLRGHAGLHAGQLERAADRDRDRRR